MDELRDRQLGLAVARAAGDVGEEGVGDPHADQALAVLVGDPAERDQFRPARAKVGRSGGAASSGPERSDVLGQAVDGRRLQEAGELAGGEDRPPRRAEEAGVETAVEARSPRRQVGAEEGESRGRTGREARNQLRAASGPKAASSVPHRRLGPARPGPAADQELRLKERPGVAQFRVERRGDRRGARVARSGPCRPRLRPSLRGARAGASVAVGAAGLPAKPPPQPRAPPADRRQAGRHRRCALAPLRAQRGRSPRRRAAADRARAPAGPAARCWGERERARCGRRRLLPARRPPSTSSASRSSMPW